MKFIEKLKKLTEFKLVEDDNTEEMQTSTNDLQDYYAIEVTSDFEGNDIPKQYRNTPIYLGLAPDGPYLTKSLIRDRSLFSKQNPILKTKEIEEKYPKLKQKEVTEFPERVLQNFIFTPDNLVNRQDATVMGAVNTDGIDLSTNKEKYPDLVTPDAKIIHSSTGVDTREIKAYINAGIHPAIAYTEHPKPGWWYEDEKGKKHLIRLYGITEPLGDTTNVIVKEVLGFSRTPNGYLKTVENPHGMLMPAEEFNAITKNTLNKETYEELMKKVPEEERDNPDLWMDEVLTKEQKMRAQYAKWKEDFGALYNFDEYTPTSLIKVFEANVGRNYPMKIALRLYGKKLNDVQAEKFLKAFETWKAANREEYDLDRFSDEELYDVFSDVHYKKDDIETALMNNLFNTDDIDDDQDSIDFVDESVDLTEAGDSIRSAYDERSKYWIISDPNTLRDLAQQLNIDEIYISNPFTVTYRGLNGKEGEHKFDKVDQPYIIVGFRKPRLAPLSEIDPKEIKIAYIKDWNKVGARAEAISMDDLHEMLSVAEPISIWERYRTYKDQKRPLNRGAYFKYVNIPEEVVREALTLQMQKVDDIYYDIDLLTLYDEALQTKQENKFVTKALRSFAPETTIRAKGGPNDFSGYQYAQSVKVDSTTQQNLPVKAKHGNFGKNPYNFLMTHDWK